MRERVREREIDREMERERESCEVHLMRSSMRSLFV